MLVTWGSVQWAPVWTDQITRGAVPEAKAYTQFWQAAGAGIWGGNSFVRRQFALFCAALTLVSGATGTFFFTAGALWRIYNYTRGIPRLINAVCDKCLLAGYVQKRPDIDYRLVGTAIRELEGVLIA